VLLGAAALAIGWVDYLIFSESATTASGGSGFFGLDGSSAYRITYVVAGILLVAVGAGKILASLRAPTDSTTADDN
jgi:ABC-type nitrate/sulfonate/bicarbonate transport system permease component